MEVKPVSPVFVDQALDRYIAACLKMFALLDRNDDGKIEMSERPHHRPMQRKD